MYFSPLAKSCSAIASRTSPMTCAEAISSEPAHITVNRNPSINFRLTSRRPRDGERSTYCTPPVVHDLGIHRTVSLNEVVYCVNNSRRTLAASLLEMSLHSSPTTSEQRLAQS